MRETSAPMVEYARPVSEIEASHGTPYPGGGGGALGVLGGVSALKTFEQVPPSESLAGLSGAPSHRDAWIFPNPVVMDDVREGTVPADASRRARAHRAQHADVSEGRSARPSRRGIRRPARFRVRRRVWNDERGRRTPVPVRGVVRSWGTAGREEVVFYHGRYFEL